MAIKLTARHSNSKKGSQPFFEKSFTQHRITIGNDSAASLRLNGSVVAAEQLVIVDGMVEPIVINRAQGTWLNGESLAAEERRSLRDGDLLFIGTYVITVSILEGSEVPAEETQVFAEPEVFEAETTNTITELQEEDTVSKPVSDQTQLLEPTFTDELSDTFKQDTHKAEPTKTFAAILDGLRTDEDRFYFLCEGGPQSGSRVAIELDEMPLGWTISGDYLSFDVAQISALLAIVRKDWSGVVLQPQTPGISVNVQPVTEMRRLRDGDRVSFAHRDRRTSPAGEPTLVFREPASLVILDSLMPRVLPPENDPSHIAQTNGHARTNGKVHNSAHKLAALFKDNREYFGAFTLTELSLMTLGTLVGAIIIFLILNYS